MRRFISLLLILSLAGCDRQKPQQSTAQAPEAAELNMDQLFSLQKSHIFSKPSAPDTFTVEVTGKDLLTATVYFRITSPDGKVIYNEQFATNYLIDYGIMDSSQKITDETRRAYIQERLNRFFDETNFRKPAIKATQRYDDYNTSRELFDELKANPSAWSFFYRLGKEDGRYIAWSEKFKRVMMFYNCC